MVKEEKRPYATPSVTQTTARTIQRVAWREPFTQTFRNNWGRGNVEWFGRLLLPDDRKPHTAELGLDARLVAAICATPLKLMRLRRSTPLPAPTVQDHLDVLDT